MALAEPEIKKVTQDEESVKADALQTIEKPHEIPVTGVAAAFQVRIRDKNAFHEATLSSEKVLTRGLININAGA
jgi:hypothetical protein